MVNDKRILIITGATASGKSALAFDIALKNNGVIINADALQIYQGLPILSSQPSQVEQELVPHFLYSALKHDENSSVMLWLQMAQKQINDAFKIGKLPIVVGGTGLYISKLVSGINEIPEIEDEIRSEVRNLIENQTKENLIKILVDSGEEFNDVVKLDKQRLGRRLEVLKQTGKTLSWWQKKPNKKFYPVNNFEFIHIELPREKLYENCDKRLEEMFKSGAIEEVRKLINLVADHSVHPITKTIGFLEIKDYLEGKISIDEALKIAQQKTRNYAKRQLTWFRNQKLIQE